MAFTKVSAALLVCAAVLALVAQGEAVKPCRGLLNTYAVSRRVNLTPVNPGFLSIREITPADCENNCNVNCECKSWSHERRMGMRNTTVRMCTLYKAKVSIYKAVKFNTTVGIRDAAPPPPPSPPPPPPRPKCPTVKPAGNCSDNSTFSFSITKTGCGVSDIATVTYKGVAKAAAGAVISLGPLPVGVNFVSQTCQVNNNNCNVCEDRGNRLLVVTVSRARFVTVTAKVKGNRTCANVPGRVLSTCGVSNLNA